MKDAEENGYGDLLALEKLTTPDLTGELTSTLSHKTNGGTVIQDRRW